MNEIITTCPHCGKVNDRHADGTGEGTPKPGDVSLCFGCTQLAIFVEVTGIVTLRKPTAVELHRLEDDPDIAAAQILLRAFKGAAT